MKARTTKDKGMALVVVVLLTAILLSISGAALLLSGLNLKASANLKSGGGAIHASDAGIQHGLALIPAGNEFDALLQGSVTGFACSSPCNGTTNKPTLTASLSDYAYSVVAENDPVESGSPTDDTNKIVTLTSTATGANGSKRVIKAYIGRTSSNSWAPPGTLFVPGAGTELEFRIRGSATLSGNDTNVDGSPGSSAAIPGVATNSADAATEAVAAIETPANVTGTGGTPSVVTTTSTLDVSALATDFLTKSHTVISGGTLENTTLGTWESPQITRVTGDVRFRGTSSGAGVLIVDGDLEIEDTFNFKGLIILRGGGELEIEATGNSAIYGGILIAPASSDSEPEIEIEGGGTIKYSSEALSKVNDSWPGVLPQKARLIGWHEVMQ